MRETDRDYHVSAFQRGAAVAPVRGPCSTYVFSSAFGVLNCKFIVRFARRVADRLWHEILTARKGRAEIRRRDNGHCPR